MSQLQAPLDVPKEMQSTFLSNWERITNGTGHLMLFAGDQKVEHLNDDFYGEGISKDDASPEHIFTIAQKGKISVFASQLGLIAKYGADFRDIPYIIKLNSKTNLVKTDQKEPLSPEWYPIGPVAEFKKTSGLDIVGIGYTIYLGSEFEHVMLKEAARIVYDAHKNGLLATLWIYPRGAAIKDERAPHLIAGAAGVAASLGADYVKVNPPQKDGVDSNEALKEAITAAGKTRLICAGGSSTDVRHFLTQLHDQIHIAGTSGNATGRNIHQKPLDEAVRFCNAIYAITIENKTVDEAIKIYNGI